MPAPASTSPTALPRLAKATVESFASDGSLFDLAAPDPAAVCFVEIGQALAGQRRFNGRGISVAQHCAMGARAILNENGSPLVAALYLLHDAHQWALGDICRPLYRLLACQLQDHYAWPASSAFTIALGRIRSGWGEAIYIAADLPPPYAWTPGQADAVKSMSVRMRCAEAIALFGPRAGEHLPHVAKPKTTGAITVWGAAKAEEEFATLAHELIGPDVIARQAALVAGGRDGVAKTLSGKKNHATHS